MDGLLANVEAKAYLRQALTLNRTTPNHHTVVFLRLREPTVNYGGFRVRAAPAQNICLTPEIYISFVHYLLFCDRIYEIKEIVHEKRN